MRQRDPARGVLEVAAGDRQPRAWTPAVPPCSSAARLPLRAGGAAWARRRGGNTLTEGLVLESIGFPGADKKCPR